MNEKYLWLILAVIAALALGQSRHRSQGHAVAGENYAPPLKPDTYGSLYAEKAYDAQWKEFEKWRAKVQDQLWRGEPLLDEDFDIFFNDHFFARKVSPFSEMERMRRELSGRLGLPDRFLFDGYWDKWFEQRMRLGEFRTEVVRTDKDVALVVTLPGLVDDTLTIDIAEERIKIAFSARSASEHRLGLGVVKKEARRNFVKILQLPEDAAPGTGKVKVDGEVVKIRFDLRKADVSR